MTDEIDVEKVAKLACLKLNKEEGDYFRDKFKEIISYIGKISQVEITADMLEKDETLQKIFRKDKRLDSAVSPEQFSDLLEIKFFKVPKVID